MTRVDLDRRPARRKLDKIHNILGLSGYDPTVALDYLCDIVESDPPGWRQLGHTSLRQFLTHPYSEPPHGLGLTADEARLLVRRHRDEDALPEVKERMTVLRRAVDEALTLTLRKNEGRPKKDEDKSLSDKDYGTARSYVLARLQRDDPALYERVMQGELSSAAAARQAGFRKPTTTVRLDDMESAARSLRTKLRPKQVRELIAQLEASL